MSRSDHWSFPVEVQPQQQRLQFDLERAMRGVVLVHAEIPDEAFTAAILGTERIGHGAVIGRDGLVLTIGYLITEAESIWLTTHDGSVVPGHALAYDPVSGFGLVLPLGRLDAPCLERGSAANVAVDDEVIVIAHGGREHCLTARVIARREFAGYWEYLVEKALFTAPPHPQWGGTALLDLDGRLIGIGSLILQEAVDGDTFDVVFEAFEDDTNGERRSPRQAEAAAVLRAFRDGLDLVPLDDGGWAPLPINWLTQHGHRVADVERSLHRRLAGNRPSGRSTSTIAIRR